MRTKTSEAGLSQKEYLFVSWYLRLGNARQAALKAGYAETSATCLIGQLEGRPQVKSMLEYGKSIQRKMLEDDLAEHHKSLNITVEYKMAKLRSIIDNMIPDDMADVSVNKLRTGIAAIAELNKMQGHYAPEKHLTLTADVTSTRIEQTQIAYGDV